MIYDSYLNPVTNRHSQIWDYKLLEEKEYDSIGGYCEKDIINQLNNCMLLSINNHLTPFPIRNNEMGYSVLYFPDFKIEINGLGKVYILSVSGKEEKILQD